MMNRNVLIYRDRLLDTTEIFIREQAESLCRFTPYYLGSRPVSRISMPEQRTMFIGGESPIGRLREIIYKGLYFAPAILRKVRSLHPALVHAHFGLDGVEAMPIASALNIPLVVTFHGFDATTKDEVLSLHRRGQRYLRNRRKLAAFGAQFIAVSEFIASVLRETGFPEDRIQVHYIGVNVDSFRPDPSISREPLILFVGRLVEKKGCEYVIHAAASLQKEIKGLKLVIIGDGPLRGSLEQLVRTVSCDCQFLGVQASEAVRDWMNRAKVFCTPSIIADSGDAEGFGIVFAEAQAMEVPVVSFASGGIPEAVEDGVTGLLAPERDWRALARHLKTLLKDDVMWRKFSQAARERVCQKFNLKHQTVLLENIYDEVLEEWHSKAGCSLNRRIQH